MRRSNDPQAAAILEAASRLLSAEGPAALTVRRIATEAGCSTMGLYSRFGGKDGVVDELYAEGFEYLTASAAAQPTTDDPVADLMACGRTYRRAALELATHYMVMFGGAVPGFQPSEASLTLALGAFGCLESRVQRCVDAGALAGDATRIAEILWGSIHGLVMLELVGIETKTGTAESRLELLLETLIAGLTPRPRARD